MDEPTINSLCRGALPELLERALREVAKNLKDPNTQAEAVRKITVEIRVKGFADRSGAEVQMAVQTKVPGFNVVKGTIYVKGEGDGVKVLARDPRQDVLFDQAAGAHKA